MPCCFPPSGPWGHFGICGSLGEWDLGGKYPNITLLEYAEHNGETGLSFLCDKTGTVKKHSLTEMFPGPSREKVFYQDKSRIFALFTLF